MNIMDVALGHQERLSNLSLVSNDYEISYRELDSLTRLSRERKKGVVILLLDKGLLDALLYVWAIRNFTYVIPLHVSTPKPGLDEAIKRLSPDSVLSLHSLPNQSIEGFVAFKDAYQKMAKPEGSLNVGGPGGLILGTSGSTGSSKYAVLSEKAVISNASDIVLGLGLTNLTVSICALPLSYSYGLSVLHSTLLAGGKVVFGVSELFSRSFVDLLASHQVSHLPGVPSHHEIYERLGIFDDPPHFLSEVTQAGGFLSGEVALRYATKLKSRGVKFFKMYGQTEATARMSILPAEMIFDFPDSVGKAVESGSFEIAPDGEIVFKGPNVMSGYVKERKDLVSLPSEPGPLMTGDLGYVKDGLLFITGRKSRIMKISGSRVDLDFLEQRFFVGNKVFLVDEGDSMVILARNVSDATSAKKILEVQAGLLERDLKVLYYRDFAYLPSGKIDRKTMLSRAHS